MGRAAWTLLIELGLLHRRTITNMILSPTSRSGLGYTLLRWTIRLSKQITSGNDGALS